MKEENNLLKIPYYMTFKRVFNVDRKIHLILDTIHVYGLNNGIIDKEVDYKIELLNGRHLIYPYGEYREYCIMTERIVNTKSLTISSDESLDVIEKDGNYEFVIKYE